MDGVTILATSVYREIEFSGLAIIVLLFMALYIWFSWLSYDMYENYCVPRAVVVIGWLFVTAAITFMASDLYESYLTIHTDHLVTVNDTVGVNEFVTHYEVLKHEGTLFTVRERGGFSE
jgi:hypothetical protein